MKKTVLVLFGGCSSEHEISRLSAATMLRNLSREKYEPVTVGITKSGRWFLTSATPEEIENGQWENCRGNRTAFLSPDRSVRGLVVMEQEGTRVLPVDVVLPALHGKNGEDGTVQGLLQLSGLPFVGCAARASAVCMDKAVTHTLLTAARVKQANYLWLYAVNYETGAEKVKTRVRERLGYPVFVKPANAGSSVGVSKVTREEDLDAAMAKAAHEDDKILIEEAIEGQEVECAVLGNDKPEAAPMVGEIAASAEFYDYDDKYISGTSQLYLPAHLDPEVAEEIRRTACRAYRMLGCQGLARVDFFVRGGKEVILNEINTMPGFTAISMYPKLWESCGVSCTALLDRFIGLALER